MLREIIGAKLRPAEQFRMYEQPVTVELQYAKVWKDPFEIEAEVQFNIGNKQQFAFTRLNLIDEENGTARATLIGERNGDVLVVFPPTNFGETRFYADSDSLLKIVRLPDKSAR